jgi:ketosteroid isomerase-like protein
MMGWLLLAAAAITGADPLVAEMQRIEESRNAAIKAGDMEKLGELYAPDFQGISSGGARVDRETLLNLFKRNAGGDFVAESTILSARQVGDLVLVEGRLKLHTADRSRLISDSFYLHVMRRRGDGWEMIEGAATPIPASSGQ